MVGLGFKKSERSKITLLIGGLTLAQDYLIEGGLRGVGYNTVMLDVPTTEGFQTGKEFGNRGQCNPTYFTVGNLVQYLITLRDKHGMSSQDVVDKFVFLTAGACGPCRFGMYVTEYRKALRDAGFDGFRVMLFQQTGGLKQATGDEVGLELNPTFFWAIVKGMIAGDAINAIGYRMRPYEVVKGSTNAALEQCKKIIYKALEEKTNILYALWQCKPVLAAVAVDKTLAKPKVSIIGEFWAMTTEGDGNYQLQSFLEGEGALSAISSSSAHGSSTHSGKSVTTRRRAQSSARWTPRSTVSAAPARRPSSRSSRSAAAATSPFARGFQGVRARARPLRLQPSGHGRNRGGRQPKTTTTTISAAAKATWKSAS